MQRNIVKKMLMVMALSTSMAYADNTNAWENTLRNRSDASASTSHNRFGSLDKHNKIRDTQVKSGKNTKKHNRQSKVSSSAGKFESGAANNAQGTTIPDPAIVAASTVENLNSPISIQGTTANISDLVPADTQNSSLLTSAQPQELPANTQNSSSLPFAQPQELAPHLDELFGSEHVANNSVVNSSESVQSASELNVLSGAPSVAANTQDSSALVTDQSQVVAPLTVPASNNLIPNDQHTMPVLNLDPTPTKQDLAAAPIVSGGEVLNDSFDQGSGVFSRNDSTASTVVVPKPQELSANQDVNNQLTDMSQSVVSGSDSIANQLSEHREEVADNTAAQLAQHQQVVAANTAAQLAKTQETMVANTAAQLEQHQGAVEEKLAQQQEVLLSAIQNSANAGSNVPVTNASQQEHQPQELSANQDVNNQQALQVNETPQPQELSANQDVNTQPATMTQVENTQPAMMTQGVNNQQALQVNEEPQPQHYQDVNTQPDVLGTGAVQQLHQSQELSANQVVNSQPAMMTQDENTQLTDMSQSVVQNTEINNQPLSEMTPLEQPMVPDVNSQPAMMTQDENTQPDVLDVNTQPDVLGAGAVQQLPQVAEEVPVATMLSDKIMKRIANAANKSIELKGIIGGKADKDMLQAKLATVKAANDLREAQSGIDLSDKIDGISKRLTELLKMPEAECEKKLEAIDAELENIKSMLASNVDTQTTNSGVNNTIVADKHIGMEHLPFTDGNDAEKSMVSQR